MSITQFVPILALLIVAYLLYKSIVCCSCHGILKYVIVGSLSNFLLIAIYWASNDNLLNLLMVPRAIRVNLIPRIIYAVGVIQVSLLAIVQLLVREDCELGRKYNFQSSGPDICMEFNNHSYIWKTRSLGCLSIVNWRCLLSIITFLSL
jgi:hypothetical protein